MLARVPRCRAALLLLLGAGCTQITSFDLSVVEEASEALCADGTDNDADGLTDCQDWKCLGVRACCDVPRAILEDDFEVCANEDKSIEDERAQQTCGANAKECAPNPDNWQAWGSPFPLLCDGGLSPHKEQQCFDVGVLSRNEFDLHPGLSITVGIEGRPEPKAFLAIGLTLKDKIAGANDSCAPATTVLPIAEVRQVPTKAGYRLQARFDELPVGDLPEVRDGDRHEVRLWIEEDRVVHYSLDGVEFARSPIEVPLPNDLVARLALSGRSLTARFADALVVTSARCDIPARWTPAKRFVSLDVGWTWDEKEVFRPSILRDPEGRLDLYYMGCPDRKGRCNAEEMGVGLATAHEGTGFLRSDAVSERPLFYPAKYGTSSLPDFALVGQGASRRGYLTADDAGKNVLRTLTSPDGLRWEEPDRAPIVLEPGARGEWDDGGICCATAVTRETEVYLWYAGKDQDDKRWRIGLAMSRDGVSFVKSPANPVVVEGGFADYDGHDVSDPDVIWDEDRRLFRMWYKAQPFGGLPSIAYAVSPDGIVWSKYPENPVAAPETLEEVGSPAVLWHNGRLRMWIEAKDRKGDKRRIFGFENHGVLFQPVEDVP
jgi:hypothetical protein